MKPNCRKIQETLATEGPQTLRNDEAAQQHLAECEACFHVLESLNEIEKGFQSLSQFDAPDHVVDELLARPEIMIGARDVEPTAWQRMAAAVATLLRPRPLAWGSVAAALVIVAVAVGLRFQAPELADRSFVVAMNEQAATPDEGDTEVDSFRPDQQRELQGPELEQLKALGYLGDAELPIEETEESAGGDDNRIRGQAGIEMGTERGAGLDKSESETRFSDDFITDLPVPGRYYEDSLTLAPGVQDPDGDGRANVHGSRTRDFKAIVGGVTGSGGSKDDAERKGNLNSIEEMEAVTDREGAEPGKASSELWKFDEVNRQVAREKTKSAKKPAPASRPAPLLAGTAGVSAPVLIEDSRVSPTFPEAARTARIEARVVLQLIVRADGSVGHTEVLTSDPEGMGFEEAAQEAVEQWRFVPAKRAEGPVDVYWTVVVDFKLDGATDSSFLYPDEVVRTARAFLDDRGSTDNLSFKPATGYWSNTYVPGDPATRLLQSRLAGWDRSIMKAYVPSTPRLHEAARQVGQPFDTPDGSALAVYLHADRRGLTESGRMLVQVGIEGTPRHGGRRPAMNVALVLDLRDEVSQELAIGLRSLLEAFNRAKEPGDSFRVFVAGRPGGCVVEPDDFRHGFLKVTLDRLVAGPEQGSDLVGAVSSAIASVATVDDPDAPLGSNVVVLITGRPFGDETRTLADLAHQGAVAGAPLSVIGIGDDVELPEIDFVTLAGQGNRRLLDGPSAADDLVDRELSAASRAIARAVRLRVRLAPGVKLVDVFGSERLDERRAQRVRDAERSIDLRLARNLGIEADRGDDEEGIQVVIPSFYAGDSHVILLDVVAPGPGAVADVTVRYKDLVHLRNGVARASLGLGREARPAGPLERNVLKNLLSFRLSRTLDEAGQALKAGDAARSATLLREFAALLEGLRRELPGLDNDPDILGDIAMLGEYRTLLASGLAGRPDQLAFLADSLRYAARLKILPRPLEMQS